MPMSSTAQGRLVAHPDISLVLRGTDMKRLPQVARGARRARDDNAAGRRHATSPACRCCRPTPRSRR